MARRAHFGAATFLMLVVLTIGAASDAQAAEFRKCGHQAGIRGLVARGARCPVARWLAANAFSEAPYWAWSWSARGWTCHITARTHRHSNFECRSGSSRVVLWSTVTPRSRRAEIPLIPCRPVAGVGVRKHGSIVCDTARSAARDFLAAGGRLAAPGYVVARSPVDGSHFRLYLLQPARTPGVLYRGRVDGELIAVEISVPGRT